MKPNSEERRDADQTEGIHRQIRDLLFSNMH